jgi:hypothetical protein
MGRVCTKTGNVGTCRYVAEVILRIVKVSSWATWDAGRDCIEAGLAPMARANGKKYSCRWVNASEYGWDSESCAVKG